MKEHRDKHNLINHSQHGTTKGKLCLTNMLSFYSKVNETMDNSESYDILYLDLSNAFNKVPNQRLLKKSRAHGIDGKILECIKACLSDRHHRVGN